MTRLPAAPRPARVARIGGAMPAPAARGAMLVALLFSAVACRAWEGPAPQSAAPATVDDALDPLLAFVARDLPFVKRHLAPEVTLDTSMFTSQEDLGVSYVMVPYMLFNVSDPPRRSAPAGAAPPPPPLASGGGNFHVWLHLLTSGESPNTADVRGFFMFEPASDALAGCGNAGAGPGAGGAGAQCYYRSPGELYAVAPEFRLQPVDANGGARSDAVPLAQLRGTTHERPWWLAGRVLDPPPVYQLSIGHGLRPAPFVPRLVQREPAAGSGAGTTSPPSFHIALPPSALPPSAAVPALLRHMAHHKPLGFASWLVYTRNRWMQGLVARRAALQPHLDDGSLRVVVWEGPLPLDGPHAQQADTPLAYNHALLALTGCNAYLALVGVDEFLLLPPQQAPLGHALAAAHAGCMGGAHVACVPRVDYSCAAGGDAAAEAAAPGCADAEQALEVRMWRGEGAAVEQRAVRGRPAQCRGLVAPEQVYAWLLYDGQLVPATPGQAARSSHPQPHAERRVVDSGCAAWAALPALLDAGVSRVALGAEPLPPAAPADAGVHPADAASQPGAAAAAVAAAAHTLEAAQQAAAHGAVEGSAAVTADAGVGTDAAVGGTMGTVPVDGAVDGIAVPGAAAAAAVQAATTQASAAEAATAGAAAEGAGVQQQTGGEAAPVQPGAAADSGGAGDFDDYGTPVGTVVIEDGHVAVAPQQ